MGWMISSTVWCLPRINEVMCNPTGSDTKYSYMEFVELYNQGPDTVRLLDYTLYDLSDTNDILCVLYSPASPVGPDVFLPGHYALIVDPDYPMSENPYHIPSQVVVMTISNDKTLGNTLKNDQDCVFLCSLVSGIRQDSFCWNTDPGDGISWERVMPSDWVAPARWSYCIDPGGSTPGQANSLKDTQPETGRDIRLESEVLSYSREIPLKLVWRNSGPSGIIRIGVFDIQGFFFGWIEEGLRVSDLYQLEWFGHLPNRNTLKPGTYLLHLELKPEITGRLIIHNLPFAVAP